MRCRVELEIDVPREWIKKKSDREIGALVETLLERHLSRESVHRSEHWNRRQVEPLPEGYDELLGEYQHWRASRLRGELLSTLDETLRSAQRVIDRAGASPAYGAGLAEGMEKEANRYRSWDDCEELVGERLYPAGKDAPAELEGSDEEDWEQGYRDGQVVAFSVELARRIGACLEGP